MAWPKSTGPNVLPMSGVGFTVGYKLINFETTKPPTMNGAASYLLSDHRDLLDIFITHLVHNPGAGVQIEGYASRRGDETYNQGLSARRANAVKQYIELGVTKLNVQLFTAFGESESAGGDNNNDGVWRAATIKLFDTLPPPKADPPKNAGPKFQNFAVRIKTIASVSLPLLKIGQLDLVTFELVDIDRKRSATFQYTGASLAMPSPFSVSPVSFANTGPWKTFRVMRHDPDKVPVTLFDFAGTAVLTQAPGAGAGEKSVGGSVGISFESEKLKSKNVGFLPSGINVQGGSGFSMPALGSGGVGALKQVGDEGEFTVKIVDGQTT